MTSDLAAARADDGELAQLKEAEKIASLHLPKFDTLDFDAFTNQRRDRFKQSHAADIAVQWPDGHVTHGLERHIADLKAVFVYAPDTRIQEHPVKIVIGE